MFSSGLTGRGFESRRLHNRVKVETGGEWHRQAGTGERRSGIALTGKVVNLPSYAAQAVA